MGVDCTDVNCFADYRPDGTIAHRILFLGIHLDTDTAAERATLRNASSGSDATFRAALMSVGGASSGMGVAWDNAPTVDGWYPTPTVSSRTRLRSVCAHLPT